MAIKGFSKVNDYITMLGTGNALATRCYNTCFTLHGSGDTVLWSALGIVLIGIFVLRWEWL